MCDERREAGHAPSDVRLALVLHGPATKAALSDEALAQGGTARVQRQSYEPRPTDVKTKLRLKVEPTDVRSIRYFTC